MQELCLDAKYLAGDFVVIFIFHSKCFLGIFTRWRMILIEIIIKHAHPNSVESEFTSPGSYCGALGDEIAEGEVVHYILNLFDLLK